MKRYPDKYFDLAIVDPIYGDVTQGGYMKNLDSTTKLAKPIQYHLGLWNQKKTDREYFTELMRVSKNQIIWGGNYFTVEIGKNTQCWLVWDKERTGGFADFEIAWTSFNKASRIFRFMWNGMLQGDMKHKEYRIHPCLPKGEKVYFNGQWKNIEDVNIGDSNIFGKVSAISTHEADRIITISTTENNETRATWNHPFLVLRDDVIAWIYAEQIKKGDKILWLKSTKQLEKDICDIGKRTENCEWNIALYGKNTTAKFQRGCRFTTLTGTRLITTFPICNLSRPLNINGFTKVVGLKTENGSNRVRLVESIKRSMREIGISIKKRDYSHRACVVPVISRKRYRIVECELQTVGSVKITEKRTTVYNLTIDGIPAFETKVGISHNTQKPVKLYEWLLDRFAKPGDIILDTHVGSASSLIACHNKGFSYVGFEIDPVYYKAAKERLDQEKSQMNIFDFIERTTT